MVDFDAGQLCALLAFLSLEPTSHLALFIENLGGHSHNLALEVPRPLSAKLFLSDEHLLRQT